MEPTAQRSWPGVHLLWPGWLVREGGDSTERPDAMRSSAGGWSPKVWYYRGAVAWAFFFFFFKTIDYNPLGSSLPLKWVLLMLMKIEWDSESWPRQVQVTVWEAWLHWCNYIPSGHPITHILLSPCSLNFPLGATHICVRTLLDVLGQFCGTVSEKFCQFQSLSRCGQFPVDLPCSATPIHTTAVWLLSMLSLPRGIFPDSWYL